MKMNRFASALAALCLVLSAGCGGSTSGGDEPEDIGPVADCESSDDCSGGEACREGLCRVICTSEDDCTELLPICDEETDLCVACVEDGDCGEHERCTGIVCEDFCRSSEGCASGERCDVESGQCIEGCARRADCDAGERCLDGTCEPVGQPCSANEDCSGGQICRENVCRTFCSDDAPCEGALEYCEPQSNVCVECIEDANCGLDGACDENFCVFFCSSDESCLDGERCVPETGECEDVECSQNTDCSGGFRCRDGSCEPIGQPGCDVGAASCDGATAVNCVAGGTEERVDCGASGESCAVEGGEAVCIESGSVLPEICFPGTSGCRGDGERWTCEEGRPVYEACESGLTCEDGECGGEVCVPGALRCENANTVAACSADGSSETTTSCSAGETCNSGVCRSPDAACIEVEPAGGLDFGTLGLEVSGFRTLTIKNCSSNAELEITRIPVTTPNPTEGSFTRFSGPTFPTTIAPDDSLSLSYRAIFATTGNRVGELVVESNDPLNPEVRRSLRANVVSGEECGTAVVSCATSDFDAGDSLVARTGQSITCSAEGSTTVDGSPATRGIWLKRHEFAPDTMELSSTSDIETTVTLSARGYYQVEFVPYDDGGLPSCASAIAHLNAVESALSRINIQLYWKDQLSGEKSDVDLDILLRRGDVSWAGGGGDVISWTTRTRTWDAADGGSIVAELTFDALRDGGPELITMTGWNPSDSYSIGVDYYSNNRGFNTDAFVRVFLDGELVYENMADDFSESRRFWHVADFTGAGLNFTTVDDFYTSRNAASDAP